MLAGVVAPIFTPEQLGAMAALGVPGAHRRSPCGRRAGGLSMPAVLETRLHAGDADTRLVAGEDAGSLDSDATGDAGA